MYNQQKNEQQIEVSIVMPCLNEAQTLEICIKKAKQAIRDNDLNAEIIIADNGSTDGSQELAKKCGAKVVSVEEKGYGAALMDGIALAEGKYIIMGDADDSYNFAKIMPFVEKLREGYDLVMGCRMPWGGGKIMPGAMPWKHRWIGNPVLSSIGKIFFRSSVTDFHCGLRAFNINAYRKMDLHTTGMEFASEMVVKASLNRMKISEIPIILYKDGRSRKSHLRSWHDGWRHLRFMLLYSPRWLFLIPGTILFILGVITGGVLLFGMVRIGSVTFGPNTLLLCVMSVLVGFQLILFALFTKVFAISVGLLPDDPRLLKLNKFLNLETGLITGSVFTFIGFVLILLAVLYWKAYNFGPLSYYDGLRITVPGITISTLGIEIIFASFFLSILGMKRK